MSNVIVRKDKRNNRLNPVRHEFPSIDDAFLLYNGGAEEYEDPADYIRLVRGAGAVRAVRLG